MTMKLEKFKDKIKSKRKVLLISLGVIVLVSVSLLLYKTFAVFNEHVEFPIMNGKVDYFGNSDVYFVFYKGDQLLEEMPGKDNEEDLVFSHGSCDNGASIKWNSEAWGPIVKNLSKSKTKCSLYFEKATPIVEYLNNLAKTDTTYLKADDTNEANLRYVGSSPNNYIDIGDGSLWRIIGVMNNVTNLDDGGQQESLVKIIRAESIGSYSWDSSTSEINGSWGINEWSQADLMKLLNPNTVYSEIPTIGGSLYWNRESGECISGFNEYHETCNFTSSGISEEAKKKISKIKWNTGTFATYDETQLTASATYLAERGNHNGKEQCESNGGGSNCNDDIPRTTVWDGYIGLMYPSDFGYAVGGEARETCLGKSMYSYDEENCGQNDWLTPSSGYSWTLTPSPHLSFASDVFRVYSSGTIGNRDNVKSGSVGVQPVVYLKSTIKISNAEGTLDNPFIAV